MSFPCSLNGYHFCSKWNKRNWSHKDIFNSFQQFSLFFKWISLLFKVDQKELVTQRHIQQFSLFLKWISLLFKVDQKELVTQRHIQQFSLFLKWISLLFKMEQNELVTQRHIQQSLPCSWNGYHFCSKWDKRNYSHKFMVTKIPKFSLVLGKTSPLKDTMALQIHGHQTIKLSPLKNILVIQIQGQHINRFSLVLRKTSPLKDTMVIKIHGQ